MELWIYFWIEDITILIRELIHFFRIMHPDNKVEYIEKYDKLDDVLDRDVYLKDKSQDTGVNIYIGNYYDVSDVLEEYGAVVNVSLVFDDADLGKRYLLIAEIVNWIMRTSDTDLIIMPEGGEINFKKVKGRIYYGKESDFWPDEYIPVKYLDFDREKAFEFTQDDEWVFCSEETIRGRERWRKEEEKLEPSD